MSYQHIELVSHHLCPYVQRSVITLTEKAVEHKRIYIDLSNKPDWFVAISPTGKVPLLRIDNSVVLFESAVICEFLDETTPGLLHPRDPVLKAEHRAWNEFASNTLNEISRLYNAENAESYQQSALTLAEKFSRIEPKIQGPYFASDSFCMVDAAYGPVFRYFDVIDPFLPFDIFAGLENVQRWRKHLSERPSVQQAVTAEYSVLLTEFLCRRNCYISSLIESKPGIVPEGATL